MPAPFSPEAVRVVTDAAVISGSGVCALSRFSSAGADAERGVSSAWIAPEAWSSASAEVDVGLCPIAVTTPARLGTEGTTMRAAGGGAADGGEVPSTSLADPAGGRGGAVIGVASREMPAEAGDARLSCDVLDATAAGLLFCDAMLSRLAAAAARRSCKDVRGWFIGMPSSADGA